MVPGKIDQRVRNARMGALEEQFFDPGSVRLHPKSEQLRHLASDSRRSLHESLKYVAIDRVGLGVLVRLSNVVARVRIDDGELAENISGMEKARISSRSWALTMLSFTTPNLMMKSWSARLPSA